MREGVRMEARGEGWVLWLVLNRRRLSRAEVRQALREFGRPVGWRGAGRVFYEAPEVRRVKSHILIKQWGGYDV